MIYNDLLTQKVHINHFFSAEELPSEMTEYTDETWCARRANPACKVHAAQGGRKLGEKLVKFRSLNRKC